MREIAFRFYGSTILALAFEASPRVQSAGPIRYPKYLKANGIMYPGAMESFCFRCVISLSGKDAESTRVPSLALSEEE